MFSTLKKIFADKPIKSFELNYLGNFYNREYRETRVKKKNVIISQLIEDGSRVLDIGCGDGGLLAYLIRQKNSIRVFGVDISEDAVKLASKREIRTECIDVTKMDLPDDWMFDYIIMADFIEHIPDPERLLSRLKKHLRKAIIISLPNTGYITARLRLLIGGRFPVQWGKHPGEHLRFWTVRDFYWWTEQLGYEIERVIPVRGSFLKNVWPGLFAAKNIFLLKKR